MRLIIAGFLALGLIIATAQAADYKHPYTNVDPRNDAGNNTGDAITDKLNNAQLRHPGAVVVPAYPAYPVYPPYPGYYARVVPPPRYYTPPPSYVVAPAYPAYTYGW